MATEIIVSRSGGESRYPFPETFTFRELGLIKQLTGVRAGELEAEISAGDAQLFLCITLIAARRAGEDMEIDDLEDLPIDAIRVEIDEDQDPSQAAAAGDASVAAVTTSDPSGTPAS